MDFSTLMSEQRIRKAYEEGEFNELPGFGKPMDLNDDAGIPEELKMAHRMMKNAGYSTEEAGLKQEMMRIEDLIRTCEDDVEAKSLHKELNEKVLKYNAMLSKKRVKTNSSVFKNYQRSIEDKLMG
ncbi:succinate dehydrogenase/fumarate reductase flavoprotein subunit [Rossellomorea marisflavi]